MLRCHCKGNVDQASCLLRLLCSQSMVDMSTRTQSKALKNAILSQIGTAQATSPHWAQVSRMWRLLNLALLRTSECGLASLKTPSSAFLGEFCSCQHESISSSSRRPSLSIDGYFVPRSIHEYFNHVVAHSSRLRNAYTFNWSHY